ncbi:unnamed protein product [Prunus brigantina]
MPGLGKTTLAKQVYHHGEVKQHFDCFAWVCISQQCQGREVLKEILTKLISPTNEQRQEIADLGKDQIADRLWNTQKEKKCLVVLDDIWNSDAWSSLQAGFPMNEETGSRILLTTRNKEVASYADKNGFLFEPRSLNDDESWELFEKIAMSGTEDTRKKSWGPSNNKKRWVKSIFLMSSRCKVCFIKVVVFLLKLWEDAKGILRVGISSIFSERRMVWRIALPDGAII